jgi:hypothetical protein
MFSQYINRCYCCIGLDGNFFDSGFKKWIGNSKNGDIRLSTKKMASVLNKRKISSVGANESLSNLNNLKIDVDFEDGDVVGKAYLAGMK